MSLQASKVRLWLVVLVITAAATATAQTSSSPVAFRAIEGNREVLTVDARNSAAAGSTDSSLPDAPSAVAAAQAAQSAPPATTDEGRPPKAPVNASLGVPFIAANGILLASTIANVEMIARCQPSACQAVPDSIRNRGALYGIGIPASLGISYISYRIKRGGSRWWIVPVAVFTAGNVAYAIHASQWSH
jgi:hypothetical protein